MEVNLKALVSKLNNTCRRSLESAAGFCLSRTNFDVEIEHWLAKLIELDNTDVTKLLRYFEITPSQVENELEASLDKLKTGNSRPPVLSRRIAEWITQAWVLASIEGDDHRVRSGHLLWALVHDPALKSLISGSAPSLDAIKGDVLKSDLYTLIEGSAEDAEAARSVASSGAKATSGGKGGKTPALDQFTIDLTARAREGKIDPIVGRDPEIRQITDILTRRRQNNPILTGEAGVGKTAVVEGFALKVAEGDVPEPLQNVILRTLDLGLLQAGAGMKGEFENRLKAVISEVSASPTPIILFIDEAHTMIGAGGQAGQGDAANLLKPALARGELRTIAATTWSEYKKYFEKDPALARRFQVIKVEEPSEDGAILMMRGLADTLEKHHRLRVLDDAVCESVRLSHRYIVGRQLPDKSVSLLDTACARVAMGQFATPPLLEDLQQRLKHLEAEIRVLEREQAAGGDHATRLESLRTEQGETTTRVAELTERWEKEKELVGKIRQTRETLEGAGEESTPLEGDVLSQAQAELSSLSDSLKDLQGETPLVHPVVDAESVAEVVSGWTGIPVGKMMTDEIASVLKLSEHLEERVVGQTHALERIAQRIKTSRAQLEDPNKPIGVFMLVGPSGVGKTETALALADLLYGGERNLVTINMSEYQEAHTVSSLKGSPPGYVGYGEGGVLTEAVRRRPYCVVLLDEVEKAHHDVHELFFQVFDKGFMEDSEGRHIDFKNTLILLTSNAGTDTITSLCADPETMPNDQGLHEAIWPDLLKIFPPAFLGRLSVLPYFPLADDVLRKIIKLKLGKAQRRIEQNHGSTLEFSDAVIDLIASRCTEVSSGARAIDNILSDTLLPELSTEILSRMVEERGIEKVFVDVDANSAFSYDIQ